MDRRIKFRHLQAFVGIARAKSLKRAGEQLNLTQPAISKTLKDLESILDVSLMERGRAGIKLTAEGDVLLQYAEQSLAALQSGLTSIKTIGTADGPIITIGSLPSVTNGLLPKALLTFRAMAPEAVVRVTEGPHDYLTDRLRAGELELAIGRLGMPDSMVGLSFTQLYSEDVAIVTAPNHPLAKATQLDQLQGFPVVYPPQNSAIRPLVARMMIASGLPLFADRIESSSAAFGRAMVLGPSRAIWFISRGVVQGDLAAGNLVALDIETKPTLGPVGIMARSEEMPGPIVHLFRQSLIDAAGSSAQWA